jgi:hypothetical protein
MLIELAHPALRKRPCAASPGCIDLFFAFKGQQTAEKEEGVIPTVALSEPEASRMGEVKGSPHLARSAQTLL